MASGQSNRGAGGLVLASERLPPRPTGLGPAPPITVITHNDSDGLLALATLWRYLGADTPLTVYLSSPARLLRTQCLTIVRAPDLRNLGTLFITDLTAYPNLVTAASLYDQAWWYDHHLWPTEIATDVPANVELTVNPNRKSATHVLAEVLGVDAFVGIANEIDTNAVETPLAERMRAIVGAIRFAYDRDETDDKLIAFAHTIAQRGLAAVEDPAHDALIEPYHDWLVRCISHAETTIEVFERAGFRIGIVTTDEPQPVFAIFNALVSHERAPLDLLVFMIRHEDPARTKLEFRTQTATDVSIIARTLGGGGHKPASGATVDGHITSREVVEQAERIYCSLEMPS